MEFRDWKLKGFLTQNPSPLLVIDRFFLDQQKKSRSSGNEWTV